MPNVRHVRDDILIIGSCLILGFGIFVFAYIKSRIAPIPKPTCYSYQCHAPDMAFNCAVNNTVCKYCVRLAENQCSSEEQN